MRITVATAPEEITVEAGLADVKPAPGAAPLPLIKFRCRVLPLLSMQCIELSARGDSSGTATQRIAAAALRPKAGGSGIVAADAPDGPLFINDKPATAADAIDMVVALFPALAHAVADKAMALGRAVESERGNSGPAPG